MDVAWQDSGGSFLDSSGAGLGGTFASFGSGDGGTLWSSSPDSPLSSQSVLWESGPDAPADSHISGLIFDSAIGTDADTLSLGPWNTDSAAGLATGTLQGGLLWAGVGSDSSSSLTGNGGVGLGALDLGVASGTSSQWQQFVDQFAGGSATGLADAPQLLWTGATSQPAISVPVSAGSPLDSISPTQLMWTPPSVATGLTTAPSLADAAPTPPISGAGIGLLVPPLNGPVIAGAGSQS